MINGSKTPKEQRNLWQTPPGLFQYANKRWGRFCVDLAANAQNAKCANYYGQRLPGFALVDGLTHSWSDDYPGGTGWLNPPYDDIDPWVEKAIDEATKGFSTVMLIPTPNGDARDALLLTAPTEITYIVGRVGYIRPNGTVVKGNPRGSAFFYFGAHRLGGMKPDWIYRGEMI